MATSGLQLSLVAPVYNEAGNILPLVSRAVGVLRSLGRAFEIILVNDGSTDATSVEIAKAHARWPECSELRLQRNHGQGIALLRGLACAQGDYLLTMDGDGQNDPHDFPALLALVEFGEFDLACGWRVERQDPVVRVLMWKIANTIRRTMLADGVHDAGCQLRVMRRQVLEALFPMEPVQSFIPALAVAAGFRVGEIPVRHRARRCGISSYGLRRLWWRPAVAMLHLSWMIRTGRIPKLVQGLEDGRRTPCLRA